ncbi:unnamed protein product [Laminaria digitata]
MLAPTLEPISGEVPRSRIPNERETAVVLLHHVTGKCSSRICTYIVIFILLACHSCRKPAHCYTLCTRQFVPPGGGAMRAGERREIDVVLWRCARTRRSMFQLPSKSCGAPEKKEA